MSIPMLAECTQRRSGKLLAAILLIVIVGTSLQPALLFADRPPVKCKEHLLATEQRTKAALMSDAADAAYDGTTQNGNTAHLGVSSDTRAVRVPPWAVEDESSKRGAGLLFFAYGGRKTLPYFLLEAGQAAKTFREHNPDIQMAILTNSENVNKTLFNIHIMPRTDLLFAGENLQRRQDKIPRQWLTRLYYLAHSPFLITWALDSNVVSCTPGAAQLFLNWALSTSMSGYDIAHANQNILSRTMYPHNFNIVYKWSRRTSDLLREWLLLAMRHGVAADDQGTLRIAEMRMIAAGSGLMVGQVAVQFGAAFYNVVPRGKQGGIRSDGARITPVIQGRAHLLHSSNISLCGVINADTQTRQILMVRTGRERKNNRSVLWFQAHRSQQACTSKLQNESAFCLLPTVNDSKFSAEQLNFIRKAELQPLAQYLMKCAGNRCSDFGVDRSR